MTTPANIPPIRKDGVPKWLYETLRRIDARTRDTSEQLYATSRGEAPFSGGQVLDDSRYVLLAGRTGGQRIKGTPSAITNSLSLTSSLATFEFTNLVMRAPGMLDQPVLWGMGLGASPAFQSVASLDIQGHISITGALENVGSQNVFIVSHGNSPITTVTVAIKKRALQSANLVEFQSGSNPMSFIQGTDGTFVGPVTVANSSVTTKRASFDVSGITAATTRTLTIRDWDGTLIAATGVGNAGDVATSSGSGAAPVWSSPSSLTYVDNVFKIIGNVDPTKALQFEVDGITTATTRTLTIPDVSATIIVSTGPSTGQAIGGTLPGSGTSSDLAINGRLNIATTNFLADVSLLVSKNITTLSGTINFTRFTPSITASGSSIATYRGALIQVTGGGSINAGSPSYVGIRLAATPTGASGYSIGSIIGMDFAASISGSGAVVGQLYGIQAAVTGNSSYSPGTTDITSKMSSIQITLDPQKSNPAIIEGIGFQTSASSTGGVVAQLRGINFDNLFGPGSFTSFTGYGTIIIGTNTITNATITNQSNGMVVVSSLSGSFPSGTYITNIDGGTNTITVSANATVSSSGGSVANCTTTINSQAVSTIASGFATVLVGMLVTGPGISANTTVTFKTDNNNITISQNATASGSPVTLLFTTPINYNGAVTVWSGIYVASDRPGNVITHRILDLQSNDESQIFGRIYFRPPTPGSYPTPTAYVHIGAGAAAASSAPLKFNTGVLLTTAEAGAMEFVTDDFYLTITTGAARKGIILNDGTNLTSGRIPFATTNGRLKDDGSFLFTVGSGLTLSAINIITDTATGMKIGTATNQKLSFWNAAPIVQPTTAIAAATFVANTSGIANDSATWDGYTVGQVVKALRNAGLLA